MTNSTSIQELGEQLASDDSAARIKAREQLVRDGSPDAVRMLISEMYDPRQHVRWEAAKTLTDIADPAASAALLHAIDDEDGDVRWVASEGLIALKQVGVTAVLHGLIRRAGSNAFCTSAHHVLRESKHENAAVILSVLEALDGPEPAVSAPVAALNALEKIRSGHTS